MVHNPGTAPDERLTDTCKPDLTIVLEESVARFRSLHASQQRRLAGWDRSSCGIILHTAQLNETPALVRELRRRTAYMFITELGPGQCYQQWSASWPEFVRILEQLNSAGQ